MEKENITPQKGIIAESWPKYQSHKVVKALKIKEIWLDEELAVREDRETDASVHISTVEAVADFKLPESYRKRLPLNPLDGVGGYVVVYEDGFVSWSPAEAFESGYTKIE